MDWLRWAKCSKDRERELDEEIEADFALEIQQRLEAGATPEEAQFAARRDFGNVTRVKEVTREMWGWGFLERLIYDVRYALRVLGRAKAFTVVAILTLALGIGATTAIFSVVQGVVLAPLPYKEPDRLVLVLLYNQRLKSPTYLSYSDFRDWRRNSRSFARMAAFTPQQFDLTNPGTPEHLSGQLITWDFFRTLGLKLALGREFTSAEDVYGGAQVAMISDRLWRTRFGGRAQVLGKRMTLEGVSYTVVGVLPPGFRFLTDADFFVPLGQADPLLLGDRATHDIACVARLRPGVSIDRSQADMDAVQADLDRLYPNEERGLGATVRPLKQEVIGNVGSQILLLFGSVSIVLLIACANLANLLLARSVGRSREFAVRSALGANSGRIIRQLITEAVVLSLIGATVGLAVAKWGLKPLVAVLPGTLGQNHSIGINAGVLLFTLGISVCVALISALLPAFKTARLDLQTFLKQGGRGDTGSHRTQTMFVILQMALTVVLLVGAGLLFRTVRHLWEANPGFEIRRVITFKIGLSPAVKKSAAAERATYQQLADRLRSIPGVQAAEFTTLVPLSGNDDALPFWLDSASPTSMAEAPRATSYSVGPDYLKVMGIPLLRGRFFTLQDNTQSAPVLVIDSGLARAYFPDKDPVGQTLSLIHVGSFRVIGVVGHVQHWGMGGHVRSSPYQVYGAFYQITDVWLPRMYGAVSATIRTSLDSATIMPAVRAAVLQAGADQPIYNVRTVQELAARSMSQRFPMILMGTFAALALLLASIGTFGVIAYSVTRRVQEIGVRMALGAEKSRVFRMIIGEGLRLALISILIGGVAAFIAARLLSSFSTLLYGVGSADPVTFLSVCAVLSGVAVLAAYIPARRAMAVDPMKAIRYE
ncbi:MAG TPA: ABC transporter permease [Bryobacteraceae bacterium]|nr:ABC transporter permease [Bryobacteraceae bacterium]